MENVKYRHLEALVQSPGDSDGISDAPELDKTNAAKKKGRARPAPMETSKSGQTENTADPAKGREWSKH